MSALLWPLPRMAVMPCALCSQTNWVNCHTTLRLNLWSQVTSPKNTPSQFTLSQ